VHYQPIVGAVESSADGGVVVVHLHHRATETWTTTLVNISIVRIRGTDQSSEFCSIGIANHVRRA